MNNTVEDKQVLVLISRPLKWIAIFVMCFLFTVCGITMIVSGVFAGYFVAAVFGPGSVLGGIQLHPRSSYLRVQSDGFIIRSLFRDGFIGWHDVEGFGTTEDRKHVIFDYSESYERHQALRIISSGIAGGEGMLPDTYGLKAEELARLLNEAKERYSQGQ